MMPRTRRVTLIVLAIIVGLPACLAVAYLIWRPRPPEGAPRIGLSMASHFVVQRPMYEAALARAGGRPVLLTPTNDDAHITAMLDDVSALLLTGGDDVSPALYQSDPNSAAGSAHRRDQFEIRLIRGALDRDLPILAICRGIQILNVAHGGSIRNLGNDEALSDHHGVGMDSFPAHNVAVEAGSRLAQVIGSGTRQVNSFHGQAVDRVGENLRVCATADDGVVEAIERAGRAFVVGVQWHPEIASLTDSASLALFQELVKQADAYRRSRAGPAASGAREPTE